MAKVKLMSWRKHKAYERKAEELCYPYEVICAVRNCRTENDAERIMRKARLGQMEMERKTNMNRYVNNHKYATALREQFA